MEATLLPTRDQVWHVLPLYDGMATQDVSCRDGCSEVSGTATTTLCTPPSSGLADPDQLLPCSRTCF